MNCRTPTVIGRLSRPFLVRQQLHPPPRRQFSVKAIYTSFPATLHYYSPRRKSALFDHKENDDRPHDLYDEGVVVAKDGLVYPGVDIKSGWYSPLEDSQVYAHQIASFKRRRHVSEYLRDAGAGAQTLRRSPRS